MHVFTTNARIGIVQVSGGAPELQNTWAWQWKKKESIFLYFISKLCVCPEQKKEKKRKKDLECLESACIV